ncbi:MAG: hypothetical protein ACXABZ_07275 [Candidatus Thorarchaeota archaeon]
MKRTSVTITGVICTIVISNLENKPITLAESESSSRYHDNPSQIWDPTRNQTRQCDAFNYESRTVSIKPKTSVMTLSSSYTSGYLTSALAPSTRVLT